MPETVQDVVCRLSEGNPGALNVMMALLTQGNETDQDRIRDIMVLDACGIRGSAIWQMFKAANSDLDAVRRVLRAKVKQT